MFQRVRKIELKIYEIKQSFILGFKMSKIKATHNELYMQLAFEMKKTAILPP